MAGIFYGWIGVYYGELAQMIDTWAYHVESLSEYKLLLTHPLEFFTSIFSSSYEHGYTNFLSTHNSWWNDVKANFLIKIMAVFNVLSFGHYYVNVIFICFATMFGPIALYRVTADYFRKNKLAILLACFVIPSFLYWTSGLHKEGLIFTALSFIIYSTYFTLKDGRITILRVLAVILGIGLILILRNFLILPLLPVYFAWLLSAKTQWRPSAVYGVVIVSSLIVFFAAKYINPSLDFPQATVTKQQEFMKLGGRSAVAVTTLKPEPKSFLQNFPQSVTLSMIRPYPSDVQHLLSLAAAVEIGVLLLFTLLFLFCHKPFFRFSAFSLFLLCFAVGVMLTIGYTVNVLGAIVRYRSIVLPFLIVPMAARIDWPRVQAFLTTNMAIKNNL